MIVTFILYDFKISIIILVLFIDDAERILHESCITVNIFVMIVSLTT